MRRTREFTHDKSDPSRPSRWRCRRCCPVTRAARRAGRTGQSRFHPLHDDRHRPGRWRAGDVSGPRHRRPRPDRSGEPGPTTFSVHAKGQVLFRTTPQYDADRVVTKASLDHGKIVLDLETIDLVTPGGTLGYTSGRNVLLDLTYTISQNAPLKLRNHRELILPGFVQGDLADPEVDAFRYRTLASGMNYRLFAPTQGGGAERLWARASVRSSSGCTVVARAGFAARQLLRQRVDPSGEPRGARFLHRRGQRIFDGAYVVAPQSTRLDDDGPGYAPQIKAIVDDRSPATPSTRPHPRRRLQQRWLHDAEDDGGRLPAPSPPRADLPASAERSSRRSSWPPSRRRPGSSPRPTTRP